MCEAVVLTRGDHTGFYIPQSEIPDNDFVPSVFDPGTHWYVIFCYFVTFNVKKNLFYLFVIVFYLAVKYYFCLKCCIVSLLTRIVLKIILKLTNYLFHTQKTKTPTDESWYTSKLMSFNGDFYFIFVVFFSCCCIYEHSFLIKIYLFFKGGWLSINSWFKIVQLKVISYFYL